MSDVLIRDVSEPVLDVLKQRAALHRRSLQQELLCVLDAAAQVPPSQSPAEIAAIIRTRLAQSGRRFSDSTPLIRDDRSR